MIVCLCAAGCAWGGEAISANQAAQVYARATNQFAAAIFFKPAEATNADLACQLAPLIIQEGPDKQAAAASIRDQVGTPAVSHDVPASPFVIFPSSSFNTPGPSNGVPAIAPSRPVVCWAADSTKLSGQTHARCSYQWWYSPREPLDQPPVLRRQGIRITLDSHGQPAVWEILADTSGLRLIFVSQSLEAAAAAEFGKPLSGRRYSVERSLDQAPKVIVPRVIDDGPLPLGPIVYLSEGTRNVSTLICRCMPAQVKQFIATRTFDLTPLDTAPLNAFLATAGTTSNAPPVLWPADHGVESRLDHCLRLPARF